MNKALKILIVFISYELLRVELSEVVGVENIEELQKVLLELQPLRQDYVQSTLKGFVVNNSFRDIEWKRFIYSTETDLLDNLYLPGLKRAVQYYRSCSYFSSRILSIAARGFGGLIHNLLTLGDHIAKPAVRLLVNEQLDQKDVEAMLITGDQDKLIAHLLKNFKTPTEALEKNRLEMLRGCS